MKYSSLYLFFFFLLSFACNLQAQDILQSLESTKAGEGTVTIHQDPRIRALIGSTREEVKQPATGTTSVQVPVGESGERRSFKTFGYRVQVYAGNNSRQAREEALLKASQVKEYLSGGYPVYTFFQSPRWLCRVGDFKSIEEADAVMRKLRRLPYFKEVSIVKEQINIHL